MRSAVAGLLACCAALATLAVAPAARAEQAPLILGTTVGLERSGLLAALLPLFEARSGRAVTTIVVSAPQALALGARGEVDVLLVDGDDDMAAFVAAGHGLDQQLVMHADVVLVGPRGDPAGARAAGTISDALRRVADSHAGWVSRGDNSGLFQLERRLWREAGRDPLGQPWYLALGQGMVPTLTAATEHQAYTLADRLTYLEQRDQLDLAILVERQPELLRRFYIIAVNPSKGPWIDHDGARVLAAFLLGTEAQAAIGAFGVERFGEAVFVPRAGQLGRERVPAASEAA